MAEIININSASFDKIISDAGSKPVLLDFWAPWCGPCKSIAPILEELASELGDKALICKVNVDENAEIAGKYNIRAIPTLKFIKSGELVDEVVGLTSKDALQAKLESHM